MDNGVSVFSKLWSVFGSLLQYGTHYSGYPKRDLNFDTYPCDWDARGLVRVIALGVRALGF